MEWPQSTAGPRSHRGRQLQRPVEHRHVGCPRLGWPAAFRMSLIAIGVNRGPPFPGKLTKMAAAWAGDAPLPPPTAAQTRMVSLAPVGGQGARRSGEGAARLVPATARGKSITRPFHPHPNPLPQRRGFCSTDVVSRERESRAAVVRWCVWCVSSSVQRTLQATLFLNGSAKCTRTC
jgi:hypothetical protein